MSIARAKRRREKKEAEKAMKARAQRAVEQDMAIAKTIRYTFEISSAAQKKKIDTATKLLDDNQINGVWKTFCYVADLYGHKPPQLVTSESEHSKHLFWPHNGSVLRLERAEVINLSDLEKSSELAEVGVCHEA